MARKELSKDQSHRGLLLRAEADHRAILKKITNAQAKIEALRVAISDNEELQLFLRDNMDMEIDN